MWYCWWKQGLNPGAIWTQASWCWSVLTDMAVLVLKKLAKNCKKYKKVGNNGRKLQMWKYNSIKNMCKYDNIKKMCNYDDLVVYLPVLNMFSFCRKLMCCSWLDVLNGIQHVFHVYLWFQHPLTYNLQTSKVYLFEKNPYFLIWEDSSCSTFDPKYCSSNLAIWKKISKIR